jgi:hypothetical protein
LINPVSGQITLACHREKDGSGIGLFCMVFQLVTGAKHKGV